jgi:hypothetical protein
VGNILKNNIDLSDCEIPPAKWQKLTGRPRFSASVISELVKNGDSVAYTKQEALDRAIDLAIDHAKISLKGKISSLLAKDNACITTHLLSRMVLAYKLRISFTHTSEYDFVESALCCMTKDSDGIHLTLDELLVIEVVEEELKSRKINPALLEYLDLFNQIIKSLGPEVNTANGFGYGYGTEVDLKFLKARPPNKMLIGTRQDGTWFFNNHYAGSLGIKLYSEFLNENTHAENETSTDIRSSFLMKDGTSKYKSLQRI